MQVHPGKKIQEELKNKGWTQRQFAFLLGKKVSEVNELIKGKRNITVQWDILLSHVLGTSRKHRLNLQNEYEYSIIESDFDISKLPNLKDGHGSRIHEDKLTSINIDKNSHKISEQEIKSEIPPEKTKQVPQIVSKEEKKEDKPASDREDNLHKEHKIDKDVDISKQQENHSKQDSKKDPKIEKIHEKNISPKQTSSTLDSGLPHENGAAKIRLGEPEGQQPEKKDKYDRQKIYNKDDKFDSYFPSKEKVDQHKSTSINVDKKLNDSLDSSQKKISPESPKKSEEKKDHHKHKEHIFRNF